MTDIRDTLSYLFLAATEDGDVRETLAYAYVLGRPDPTDSDVRDTFSYDTLLGEPPDSDIRGTLSYQTMLQAGVDEDRNTLTYFYLLATEETPIDRLCGILSYISPGPYAAASNIDPGPVAAQSSFGSKVTML